MKTSWLQQHGKKSCILFFSGWGMDPAPFANIPAQDHDLLIIYDYSELNTIDLSDLTGGDYTALHLVAWSMGVWAAPFMLPNGTDYFASATAINGTLSPIDDLCGIDAATYDTMIDNFSEKALLDFYCSMFTRREESDRFISNRPQRSSEDIFGELTSLKNLYSQLGQAHDFYTQKIVGSRDRIFSARNQTRSWGKENSTMLKVSHFPFYTWPSWDVIAGGDICRP